MRRRLLRSTAFVRAARRISRKQPRVAEDIQAASGWSSSSCNTKAPKRSFSKQLEHMRRFTEKPKKFREAMATLLEEGEKEAQWGVSVTLNRGERSEPR